MKNKIVLRHLLTLCEAKNLCIEIDQERYTTEEALEHIAYDVNITIAPESSNSFDIVVRETIELYKAPSWVHYELKAMFSLLAQLDLEIEEIRLREQVAESVRHRLVESVQDTISEECDKLGLNADEFNYNFLIRSYI